MAIPPNIMSPPVFPQTQQAQTPTPQGSPLPGEINGGLVLNIFAPLTGKTGNNANAATGADNFVRTSTASTNSGLAAPGLMNTGLQTPPASPLAGNNPFFPNSAASPQQQLQEAYANALNARNSAEQARNGYVNLANQLNGQAYQNQFAQQLNGQQQAALTATPQPAAANTLFQQQSQQAQLAQQEYMKQLQQQQMAQQQAQQMQQQAAQQQQLMQQLQQQQMMQQQAMQAQDPMAQLQQQQLQQQQAQQMMQQQPGQVPGQPGQPQPGQAQQGLANVPIETLNQMIASPSNLQQKVDAMEEIGVRGAASPDTYALLKQEAMADTSALPPGQQKDDANYIRQAALWTLGMLNKSQNAQAPTQQLAGLKQIEQIIKNPKENPDVKAAAVQALQVINRPTDKVMAGILKAATDKNQPPDVQRLAQQALSGQSIPMPGQQQAAAAPQMAAPGPGMPPQQGAPAA